MTDNQSNALKYLSRIRTITEAMRNKELEIEALRYKASGAGAIRYDKDHVQTSPQNYMEMAIADVIQLEAELEEDKASREELLGNTYSIVRKLPEPEHRVLIEWYYLNGLKVDDVCNKICRSERGFYYLRDDALESFGENMN